MRILCPAGAKPRALHLHVTIRSMRSFARREAHSFRLLDLVRAVQRPPGSLPLSAAIHPHGALLVQLARFCSCMHSRPCLAQGGLCCHAVSQRALQAIRPPQHMPTQCVHNDTASQVTLCLLGEPCHDESALTDLPRGSLLRYAAAHGCLAVTAQSRQSSSACEKRTVQTLHCSQAGTVSACRHRGIPSWPRPAIPASMSRSASSTVKTTGGRDQHQTSREIHVAEGSHGESLKGV